MVPQVSSLSSTRASGRGDQQGTVKCTSIFNLSTPSPDCSLARLLQLLSEVLVIHLACMQSRLVPTAPASCKVKTEESLTVPCGSRVSCCAPFTLLLTFAVSSSPRSPVSTASLNLTLFLLSDGIIAVIIS